MITQLITDQFQDLKLDVTTLAGMSFMVFLTIYFFVKIKPAIDSKRRINRMVRRKVERKAANDKYMAIFDHKAANAYSEHLKKQAVQNPSKPKNNRFYKKDKGYQAYLKQNAKPLQNKQIVKHGRYLRVVSTNKKPSATSNKGKITGTFIGDLPLNRKPDMPRNTGTTNSFKY